MNFYDIVQYDPHSDERAIRAMCEQIDLLKDKRERNQLMCDMINLVKDERVRKQLREQYMKKRGRNDKKETNEYFSEHVENRKVTNEPGCLSYVVLAVFALLFFMALVIINRIL